VDYIYKAWLAVMKRLQYQLEAKTRWLEMLKSDAELVESSGVTLETLRSKATEILAQLTPQSDSVASQPPKAKSKKTKKSKGLDSKPNISHILFDAYRNTADILNLCAISYLLKNGCQINDKEEDEKKFCQRRRKVEIQIQRLTEKLTDRIPKGRDWQILDGWRH
jgi:hypothetical protein